MSWRVDVVGAAAACLVVGVPFVFYPLAGASATGATKAASTPPPCSTSQLVIWLNTEGQGTAGHVVYQLELTNLSLGPCTLNGFPGVSAVGITGRQVGHAAPRNHAVPTRVVVLAGGMTGSSVL
jgi:hypothetical protein